MKIMIRNIGYTQLARHTWEYAIVQDDWYPPMPVIATGRGRSRNDVLAIARLKMSDLETKRAELGWHDVVEKAV